MIPADLKLDGFARCVSAIALDRISEARLWIVQNRCRDDIPATRDMFDREVREPIKIRRLWSADPSFWSNFIERCGVLKLVDEVLGSEFLLIRSAAFIKYPRTRSVVGWHCDEDLWGHRTRAGLTAWVPLTPVPPDSGCLQFRLGSHVSQPGRLSWDLSYPYHKVMDVDELGEPVDVPAEVGDCILMDKRAVHASGPNLTQQERIGLVLAFACCDDTDINEPAVRWSGRSWEEVLPQP